MIKYIKKTIQFNKSIKGIFNEIKLDKNQINKSAYSIWKSGSYLTFQDYRSFFNPEDQITLIATTRVERFLLWREFKRTVSKMKKND